MILFHYFPCKTFFVLPLRQVLKQETDEKLRDTLRSFDATLADIHKNIEQVEGEIAAIERTIYMCEKKIRESESTEATLQEKKRQLVCDSKLAIFSSFNQMDG